MISFDFTVRIEDRKFRFSADLLSERIAILGRSGAGKSTLAKALAGLLKPESGYIKFGKRILFDSSTGVASKKRNRFRIPKSSLIPVHERQKELVVRTPFRQ